MARASKATLGKRQRSRRRNASRASRRSSNSSSTGWARHGTALPGWNDLSTPNSRKPSRGDGFSERVSTVQYALVVLLLAGAFTLYVGHVHATQDLLAQLQEARRANQHLHLKHNRLKGAYDRATGPGVIHSRARELGLRESLTYGPAIEVDE